MSGYVGEARRTTHAGGWTLGTAWTAIRKFWYLILGLTVLGGAIGYAISASTTPLYQSTATLYFAMNQGTTGSDLNQGSTYTQGQMLSFAQLAASSRVLGAVVDDLELDVSPRVLSQSIEITIPQDTAILSVQMTSPDPELAAEVANAVSEELTDVVQDIVAKNPDGTASITASVIDEAVVPSVQSSPNKTRDAGLAAVLGLLGGVLAAFMFTLADTRVRNEAAIAAVTDVPYLGSITRMKRGTSTDLIVATDPRGHVAEDLRRIQSALSFANVDGRAKKILVTSPSPAEGKSTFSTNLAITLADLGERPLIIDADLRKPRVAKVFDVEGAVGLTTVVLGAASREEAILPWREQGPDLMLSGALPPSPATVLTSRSFIELLEEVGSGRGQVIIDSPPVLTVADTNLIAPHVDGVIIVVDSTKTTKTQLAATLRTLEVAGARVLGIVLNRMRLSRDQQSYYTD